MLTVHAQRHEEQREKYRTEFRYGSFTRSITLPTGADEGDMTASYDNGILEVSVGLKEPKQTVQRITVEKKS